MKQTCKQLACLFCHPVLTEKGKKNKPERQKKERDREIPFPASLPQALERRLQSSRAGPPEQRLATLSWRARPWGEGGGGGGFLPGPAGTGAEKPAACPAVPSREQVGHLPAPLRARTASPSPSPCPPAPAGLRQLPPGARRFPGPGRGGPRRARALLCGAPHTEQGCGGAV